MIEGEVERVAAGYDAVYQAIPRAPAFQRLWREHSLGADYPGGFEHISFLTLAEMRAMAEALSLSPGSLLVDLACGMGGPGLWVARQTGARLVGIDISGVALAGARDRAAAVGMADAAEFRHGTFAATGFDDDSVDGGISVDALQYAPSKVAAVEEVARVLRRGGRFVFACFELTPERVAGLPVLGTDPVDDYRLLLEGAGFDVIRYDESAGWEARVTATYRAVVEEQAALVAEMGKAAYGALLGEITLTLARRPYRRRVLVCGEKA